MEALILTSALLALARHLTQKKEAGDAAPSSATREPAPTQPVIVRDPPPPPPPPPPPSWKPPEGVEDKARLERAHALALQVAQLIKTRGAAYDRNLVGAFQREAGLAPDGIYGPRTAGAVKWYTGESIPPLSGRGFEGYAPFGTVKSAPLKPATSKADQRSSAPKAAPTTTPARQPSAPSSTTQKPQAPKPKAEAVPATPPKTPATIPSPVRDQKQTTPPVPARPKETALRKPEKPAPVVPSIPSREPSRESNAKTEPPPTTTPGGADGARLDRAAALAKQVAANVKTSGKAYDRTLVTTFQREAGLTADGIYGPRSAGAVKWYTEETIPPPAGGALVPYTPAFAVPSTKPGSKPNAAKPEVTPPTPPQSPPEAKQAPTTASSAVRDRARLDRAAALAKRVAENLKEPGKPYDRALATEFQREAGLTPDGAYGPKTAGAIKWYTGDSITPKTGRGFAAYVPNF